MCHPHLTHANGTTHNRQYCEPFRALDQPGLTSRSVNCLG
jgi:hypothetical protein